MNPVRQTEKKYCQRALTFAIIVAFILILFGFKAIAKGLVLGTLFSLLNFILMGETISGKIHGSQKKAFINALGSILFRYLIMAVPLILALKYEQFHLFAVITGLFMIQIMILIDHLLRYYYQLMRGRTSHGRIR